jgi:hypothetical protein
MQLPLEHRYAEEAVGVVLPTIHRISLVATQALEEWAVQDLNLRHPACKAISAKCGNHVSYGTHRTYRNHETQQKRPNTRKHSRISVGKV